MTWEKEMGRETARKGKAGGDDDDDDLGEEPPRYWEQEVQRPWGRTVSELPIRELRLESSYPGNVSGFLLWKTLSASVCLTQSLFDSVSSWLVKKGVQAKLRCIRFSSVFGSKILCCANVKKRLQKQWPHMTRKPLWLSQLSKVKSRKLKTWSCRSSEDCVGNLE